MVHNGEKIFGSCISLRDRFWVTFSRSKSTKYELNVGGYEQSNETSKRLWHHCEKISFENAGQFPNHTLHWVTIAILRKYDNK